LPNKIPEIELLARSRRRAIGCPRSVFLLIAFTSLALAFLPGRLHGQQRAPQKVIVLELAPDDPANASPEKLPQARDILQHRLDLLWPHRRFSNPHATVAVSNNMLRVELGPGCETEHAITLASRLGAAVMIASDQPLEEATLVEKPEQPLFTDADFTVSGRKPKRDQMSSWAVPLVFRPEARQRFAEYTASHVGGQLNLLLDGTVLFSARIMEPIRDGNLAVHLKGEQQAQELVLYLSSGRLPYRLRILSENAAEETTPHSSLSEENATESESSLFIILLLIAVMLFGHRIVKRSSGEISPPMSRTTTMSVSSPSNSPIFPVSASRRAREDATVGAVAELMGADDLLSKRFIGAFVILFSSLNGATFERMIQIHSNSIRQDLILRLLFSSSVFLIVAALVLRRGKSVVTSAFVVALIYSLIAYAAGQVLFPYHRTLYGHFEVRSVIASFTSPFLWIVVLSLSLDLLRPWWLALTAGLWLYKFLSHFVIDAIYRVGTPYWSPLPSSEEGWIQLATVMVQFLVSAVITTILFAVLLRFTGPSDLRRDVSDPVSSRCASAYPG
jgi:hypothetical protein